MAQKSTKPFVLLSRNASGTFMLADPRAMRKPPVTQILKEAHTYANRSSGLKLLRRNPKLRAHFRCARAR